MGGRQRSGILMVSSKIYRPLSQIVSNDSGSETVKPSGVPKFFCENSLALDAVVCPSDFVFRWRRTKARMHQVQRWVANCLRMARPSCG